jgi:predicted transcriptional regulator
VCDVTPVPQLGSLEERVMALMWSSGALAVRDVARGLGGELAYTTVMTTLDRL